MTYEYSNPEHFQNLATTNFELFSGNIFLWGAGKIGSVAAHVLKQKGINILGFVDSKPTLWKSTFCGYNIISPEKLYSSHSNSVVIVATQLRREIMPKLIENEVKCFDAWSLLLKFDWADYDFMNHGYMTRMVDYYFRAVKSDLNLENKYFLDTLIVKITNKCTLRCENCASFTPYIDKPQDFNFHETMQNSLMVIDAIGNFRNLSLFGGEPFINKSLPDYINKFCQLDTFEVIDIITNGTLVPNEELINALKSDPRIYVRISDYGKTSKNKDTIVSLLEDNNIKYEVIDYKNWYKKSDIRPFFEGDEELYRKYVNCLTGSHPLISNGKLYLCKVAAALCDEGVFPESDTNCLDLKTLATKTNDEKNNAICNYISKLYSKDFMDACRYCSGKVSTDALGALVPVAQQSNYKLRLEPIDKGN